MADAAVPRTRASPLRGIREGLGTVVVTADSALQRFPLHDTLPSTGCQGSSAVEQGTHKPLVGGSIPLPGTIFLRFFEIRWRASEARWVREPTRERSAHPGSEPPPCSPCRRESPPVPREGWQHPGRHRNARGAWPGQRCFDSGDDKEKGRNGQGSGRIRPMSVAPGRWFLSPGDRRCSGKECRIAPARQTSRFAPHATFPNPNRQIPGKIFTAPCRCPLVAEVPPAATIGRAMHTTWVT